MNLIRVSVPLLFAPILAVAGETMDASPASWWSVSHVLGILGVMALLIAATAAWGITLRRRVQAQTFQIRERLERETALEQSYRDLVENANDIIYTHDLQGNLTDFNRAGEKITGYRVADAVTMNISRLIAPEQLSLAREMTARKVAGQPLTTYELDLVTSQGTRITVEISSRPIHRNGKVTAIQGIARDITERRRVERALRENDERLRDLFENATDLIQSATADHKFEYANYAWLKTLGYAPEDLAGLNLKDVIHRDHWPHFLEHFERVLAGEKLSYMSAVFISRDGRAVPVEGSCTCRVKDGKAVAVRGIFRDLTERKRAEDALEESERRYRFLFERSPLPMWVYDDQTLQYLEVSEAAVRHYGYSRREFLAMTIKDIRPPEEISRLLEYHAQPPARRGYAIWKHRKKDGTVIDVEVVGHDIRFGTKEARLVIVRDITERRRAEAALRESEERFRTLVASMDDIVFTLDRDQRHVGIFGKSLERERLSAEKFLGRTATEVLGADAGRIHHAANERALKGEHVVYEWSLPAGKRTRFLQTSLSPIRDAVGEITGLVGVGRDISLRKQAEIRTSAFSALGQRLSAASKREEAARIIAEVADSLIGWDAFSIDLYVAAEDKVYSLLNADLVAGARQEVAPAYFGNPPSPQARRVLEQGPLLILRDQTDLLLPHSIPFGDTGRPSASLLFVQVRNGKNVVGFLTIQSYTVQAYTNEDLETLQSLADLCGGALERIHAEEALRQSDEKFRQLVEQAADAFFVHTLDGKFVDVNQRACDSLNYSRDELLALSVREVQLHPDSGQAPDTWQTLSPGAALTVQASHRRKDGTTFPVETRIGRVEAGGRQLILILARDITDRLTLEAQLRHSHKLESIGRLAAGVAHDFNNILTIIQGYTAILQAQAGFSEELREAVTQIAQASQRAANLTRQLLTFSRRHVIQSRPLQLNEVITNINKLLHRVIGENIELQFNYGPALPLIDADPGMVEQIILNLAVNARDAMPKGGVITIETRAVMIDENYLRKNPEARAGASVCLSVQDNGIGMDELTMSRIFEPFFTTKELGKGTGLGLATAYGIVKQHQGWIEVSSRLGEGSIFRIFFPATSNQPHRIANEPGTRLEPFKGQGTILVVEDELQLRTLARTILAGYGYRVLDAGSGVQAMTIWREHSDEISLLFTDMVMPEGVSGRELAELLQSQKPTLKVIYTSGYSPEVLQLDFALRPGVNFLPKPYRPATLATLVRSCLESGASEVPS